MVNLKFLAYDSVAGLFVPNYIDFINNIPHAVGLNVPGAAEQETMSQHIMQYTGCDDKNKKPVYSGHVVAAYETKWEVIFSQGQFCLHRPGKYRSIGMSYCEVIGNVFEHPKLIFKK